MGLFDKLSEMVSKQALQTMKAFSNGRSNPVDAMNALRSLANGGKLFLKKGGTVYDLKSYFGVNGSDLENVAGMLYTIRSVSSNEIISYEGYRFRKADARDCENIRFDRY